jgi:hypothetical protein
LESLSFYPDVVDRRCKKGNRNMSSGHSDDLDELMEKRLFAQLVEIETSIAQLLAEKAALQRLITRVRGKRIKAMDVTRRNSIDRIIVEDRISEILRKFDYPVVGSFLFNDIRSIIPAMNKSTFRSHLNRMKNKGMINPSGRRGYWTLP